MMAADREVDDVRQEMEALRAAFASEQEKASTLEDALRDAQAELASRGDDSSSENIVSVERPVYVTPARRIDKFRGQPQKPGDATVYEWVADARGLLATVHTIPQASKAALLIDNLGGRARQEIVGRGTDTSNRPDAIFQILLTVFGDGDLLPQLQQRFFSYLQREGETLVTCSLSLLELYERMAQWDPALLDGRERALKGRLAEAVRDESLRRELRRLNMESPELGYFELRDRALQWLGSGARPQRSRQDASQFEVKVDEGEDLRAVVHKQAEQLQFLEEQLKHFMSPTRGDAVPRRRFDGPRLCWLCQSPDHMKANCPQQSPKWHSGGHPHPEPRFHPSN